MMLVNKGHNLLVNLILVISVQMCNLALNDFVESFQVTTLRKMLASYVYFKLSAFMQRSTELNSFCSSFSYG